MRERPVEDALAPAPEMEESDPLRRAGRGDVAGERAYVALGRPVHVPSARRVLRVQVEERVDAREQLLLDLHSGRFAGRYGPLAVDLLALLLVTLSLTGAWLFLVPRMHRGRH